MRIKIHLSLVLLGLMVTSCLEDNSNKEFELITPIVIDLQDEGTYQIQQYGRLRIAPLIYRTGIDDEQLSYLWELRGNGVNQVIGRNMVLDTVILEPRTAEPYTVLLTVKDETTGVSVYKTWDLFIKGFFGEGIIVADTKDEGLNSDLSLIMGFNFSSGGEYMDHSNDTTVFHICSRFIGESLKGKVTGILNTNNNLTRYLTVTTDQEVVRLDPDTYQITERNGEMFVIEPENGVYTGQRISFFPNTQIEVMLIDSLVYARSCQGGNKRWGYALNVGDLSEYRASAMATFGLQGGSKVLGYVFDDKNKRFLKITRWAEELITLSDGNKYFNPNYVGDKQCLHMNEGRDNIVYALMKDEKDAEHRFEIYGLYGDKEDKGNNELQSGRFNISECTAIDEALYYEFSPYEDGILYYATKHRIYSVQYRFNQCDSRYETIGDEEITSIGIWRSEHGNYYDYSWGLPPYETPAMGMMMVITTWDDIKKEGRVRCVPITGFGAGELETNVEYQEEYKGFGKITAWGVQD